MGRNTLGKTGQEEGEVFLGQGILGFRSRVGGVFLTNGYMGGCSKMFAAVKRWFNIQITNDSRYTLGKRKIHDLF